MMSAPQIEQFEAGDKIEIWSAVLDSDGNDTLSTSWQPGVCNSKGPHTSSITYDDGRTSEAARNDNIRLRWACK
jgi:hypothetical protein